MRHSHILPSSARHSTVVTSSSPAQSLGNQQVTRLQPPLQIVNQSAKLFSTTPSKSSSSTNASSIVRPTSNLNPIISSCMPSRPSNAVLVSTPSRPLPNTNLITPSGRLSRPPHNISPITPSSSPSRPLIINAVNPSSEACRLNINPVTPISGPGRPPPHINHVTPSSRPSKPPTKSNPATPSARNLRVSSQIRAPAPHIRPFKSSTSVSHDHASPRGMSSQHKSTSLPCSSPTLSQAKGRSPLPPLLQTPSPDLASNNAHPIQHSPRNLSGASTLLAQAASQPPASVSTEPPASVPMAPPASVPVTPPTSLQLPSLYSSLQSEQHPSGNLPATCPSLSQMSLAPLPSISISHSGLYSAPGRTESGIRLPGADILSLPALDLLMDVDKQAGFHLPPNMLPSPPEVLGVSEFSNAVAAGDVICLSDDN